MAYIGREPLRGEIILMDSIESSFNGVLQTFNLTRTIDGVTSDFYPIVTHQLLVSLGGVIQKPDTSGVSGFKVNANQITFAVAPASGVSCFIISYGNILDNGNIVDGTVTPAKLSTGGIYWNTAGRVGIGTTNPSSELQVVGTITATTFVGALTGNATTVTTNANLTGDVTSVGNATSIAAGVIVNADVNASAAIAGTKISPNFGSQNVVTTGTNTAASLIPTGSSVPTNGVYLPAANTVAVATNGAGRLFVGSTGNIGLSEASPTARLHLSGTSTAGGIKIVDSSTTNAAPGIEVIGKRSDINASSCFAGKLLLSKNRTEAAINSTNVLGSVAFGGNHTDGTEANILYSASIVGAADGAFNSATDMPTALVFNTGATGRAPDTANVTTGTERLRITSAGQLSFIGAGSSGSPAVGFNGSAPSNSLVIDSIGNIGIGTINQSSTNGLIRIARPFTGSIDSTGLFQVGQIRSDVTSSATGFSSAISTQAASFTINQIRHFVAAQGMIGAGSTVTNQYGYRAEANLIGATNNFGFFSNIPSGANRWNFYANGTAHNYFAGNVGIGTTSPNYLLEVNGASGASSEIALTSAAFQRHIIRQGGTGDGGVQLINQTTGSERARIDSSGRMLVGTSTASNFLGTGFPATIQSIETASQFALGLERPTNDGSGVQIAFRKTRSTTPGGVGIVSNNDFLGGLRFHGTDGVGAITAATILAAVDGTPGVNNMPGRLVFSTTAAGASSPTERMRILNGGNLLFNHTIASGFPGIANTNQGLTVEAVGSNGVSVFISRNGACLYLNRNSDGIVQDFRRSGTGVGSISVTTTNTAYNTSSDYRLKENVVDLDGAIDRLKRLPVHRFNFIVEPDTVVDGFIAHEVQDIVPEAITGEKDAVDDEGNPEYQGIDQSKLVPLLTAALQEAVAKIESLEARLTAAGI
jgi:hypothetical protein